MEKTDVCEAGKYSNTKAGCEKLQEQALCNKIISCGDLYGEAADKCGYCPTTGKIMALKRSPSTSRDQRRGKDELREYE